jgi:hypothetical protein
MDAREEIPIHKRIITPLVVRSEHIVLPLLGNQPLVGIHTQILVRSALELKGVSGEHSSSLHSLHPDESTEPEMEDSSNGVDGSVT